MIELRRDKPRFFHVLITIARVFTYHLNASRFAFYPRDHTVVLDIYLPWNRNRLADLSRKAQDDDDDDDDEPLRVIRCDRDHVFGCHKSHYRDGTVSSARRRVIVFLFALFCQFRSERPESRPDVGHIHTVPTSLPPLAPDAVSAFFHRKKL